MELSKRVNIKNKIIFGMLEKNEGNDKKKVSSQIDSG